MRSTDLDQECQPASIDVIWGVSAIAKVVGLSERKTSYLLQTGKLPGKKKGRHWISTVSALREDLSI